MRRLNCVSKAIEALHVKSRIRDAAAAGADAVGEALSRCGLEDERIGEDGATRASDSRN